MKFNKGFFWQFQSIVTGQETVILVLLLLGIVTNNSEDFFLHSLLFLFTPFLLCLLPQQPWFVYCKGFIKIEEAGKKDENSFNFIVAVLTIALFLNFSLWKNIGMTQGFSVGSCFRLFVFTFELFQLRQLHKLSYFTLIIHKIKYNSVKVMGLFQGKIKACNMCLSCKSNSIKGID